VTCCGQATWRELSRKILEINHDSVIMTLKGWIMTTFQEHKAFWGPLPELLERAKLVNKGIGLGSEKMTDRLVRYYSAQGVLDKPDRLGRDAAYNYRHLLQLVTARRLSEKGLSLEIIGRYNLSTTTDKLEAALCNPIQMEDYCSDPKIDALSTVAFNKSFTGNPVGMVDLHAEVQALKDLFIKNRDEFPMIREELKELTASFKYLRESHGELSDILRGVVHHVNNGLEMINQFEQKFESLIDKQLCSQTEKFEFLANGMERVERTLFKVEASIRNTK
jgi:hypothetical protein